MNVKPFYLVYLEDQKLRYKFGDTVFKTFKTYFDHQESSQVFLVKIDNDDQEIYKKYLAEVDRFFN